MNSDLPPILYSSNYIGLVNIRDNEEVEEQYKYIMKNIMKFTSKYYPILASKSDSYEELGQRITSSLFEFAQYLANKNSNSDFYIWIDKSVQVEFDSEYNYSFPDISSDDKYQMKMFTDIIESFLDELDRNNITPKENDFCFIINMNIFLKDNPTFLVDYL